MVINGQWTSVSCRRISMAYPLISIDNPWKSIHAQWILWIPEDNLGITIDNRTRVAFFQLRESPYALTYRLPPLYSLPLGFMQTGCFNQAGYSPSDEYFFQDVSISIVEPQMLSTGLPMHSLRDHQCCLRDHPRRTQ